jgi:hypothetical protein
MLERAQKTRPFEGSNDSTVREFAAAFWTQKKLVLGPQICSEKRLNPDT